MCWTVWSNINENAQKHMIETAAGCSCPNMGGYVSWRRYFWTCKYHVGPTGPKSHTANTIPHASQSESWECFSPRPHESKLLSYNPRSLRGWGFKLIHKWNSQTKRLRLQKKKLLAFGGYVVVLKERQRQVTKPAVTGLRSAKRIAQAVLHRQKMSAVCESAAKHVYGTRRWYHSGQTGWVIRRC